MTLLISVEGLITVLVIEGLPRFKETGNYLPSESALGCMGWCFLQGRQCHPWQPGTGDGGPCPPDPGEGTHGGWQLWGSERDGDGLGRRRGQAVLLQVCLWCCCLNMLLLVIALARWGSGANFISCVSAVIALQETVVRKGKAGWGRDDAVAPFLSISKEL